MDLLAALHPGEFIVLEPSRRALIGTGIAMQLRDGQTRFTQFHSCIFRNYLL
jgi:dUTPase